MSSNVATSTIKSGYVVIGDLIINYGTGVTFGTSYGQTGTVTFPKAFSTSTPVVTTCASTSSYSTVVAVTSTSTTSFSFNKDASSTSGPSGNFRWMAVGY